MESSFTPHHYPHLSAQVLKESSHHVAGHFICLSFSASHPIFLILSLWDPATSSAEITASAIPKQLPWQRWTKVDQGGPRPSVQSQWLEQLHSSSLSSALCVRKVRPTGTCGYYRVTQPTITRTPTTNHTFFFLSPPK